MSGLFAEYLPFPDTPDVDSVIRTSGEQRNLQLHAAWKVAHSGVGLSPRGALAGLPEPPTSSRACTPISVAPGRFLAACRPRRTETSR
ncbi:hypothetical protein LV779_24655 [Streptomyces thinghirensis]|nr:hypothetical protein [Streptomyces thinghirensis]